MSSPAEAIEKCWKTVGVFGDASCERLAGMAHCRNCEEYSRAGRSLLDREIPPGTREEWTALLATPRETAATGTLSAIVFRIGSQWLALETTRFERWVEARAVHVVPGRTNDVFRGLVNVDGELLLAFDGARMLSPEESVDETAERMFVAGDGTDRFVFAVHEVLGIRRISREVLEELPVTVAHTPSALTRASVTVEGRNVGVLDSDKFFARALRSLA
jgi:chemotaxis-related protein WspD